MSFVHDTSMMPVTDDPASSTWTSCPGDRMEAKDLALGFRLGHRPVGHQRLGIPKGAITALIGPTGSGKTTFLRSLNRMNDRVAKHWHKGEVLLEGSSIYAPGVQLMALRRRVGMVFQRPTLSRCPSAATSCRA